MDVIKTGDRVIFKHHSGLMEGVALEISPSNEYVKFRFSYCGVVLEKWFETEYLIEVLLDNKERIDE